MLSGNEDWTIIRIAGGTTGVLDRQGAGSSSPDESVSESTSTNRKQVETLLDHIIYQIAYAKNKDIEMTLIIRNGRQLIDWN